MWSLTNIGHDFIQVSKMIFFFPFLNSALIILREDEIGIQVKYSSKVYGKECLILVAHKFLFSLERLS